ncbi:MAG: AMP-binding protein, partial [Bacteroidetes bacterium]|nr:AMP-binding protein [Bacteroidota bacterium]
MSFIWFQHYPTGVNHEINPDIFPSIKDFAVDCFKKYADLDAYVNLGKSLTYAQIDALSSQFAAFLQNDLGIKKGDRIAIQMPNLLQYPVVMFGALKAGAIVVNTNPLYTPKEMKHQFNDAGVKAVIILANFASQLQQILPETNIEHIVVTQIGDMLGGLKGAIVNFVVKSIKKMVPAYSLPTAISFNTAMKKGANSTYNEVDIAGDDVAFLQYTGGTTGVAKGAMLTNRNIMANMMQIAEWKKPLLREREETIITALPLYHIFALTVNCLSMLKIGAKNILVTNPRDMPAFIKDLKKYPFTVITGVNTLFNGLLNQEAFRAIDFSKLKISVGGGMAVQKSTAEEWKQVTGSDLVEGYGLTESSPVLSCNAVDGTLRLGTIGIPLPSSELTIRDDDGNEVATGQPGEIWGRGPQIMKGYWERPEATAEVLTDDGWLK